MINHNYPIDYRGLIESLFERRQFFQSPAEIDHVGCHEYNPFISIFYGLLEYDPNIPTYNLHIFLHITV